MTAAFTHDGPGTAATTWQAHPQWAALPELDLGAYEAVIVLAAHPDDETLGAGGLCAAAHDAGLTVHVVVCTAGERSHPRSPTHGPIRLAARRVTELETAVRILAPTARYALLGVADGEVASAEDAVVSHLVDLVVDGRRTLLVAPWRRDGHPDHEAAGRAAAVAAARTSAELVEYPVWWWHWGSPDATPWERMCRLSLSDSVRRRRAAAMRAHRSQVEPLSEQPGDEALIDPELLTHFSHAAERFVREPVSDSALDRLHADDPDPWGLQDRWYERRKRELVLAALPWERFGAALEVGCSMGELSVQLAVRCDRVVAVDASEAAVAAALERTAGTGVEVQHLAVPAGWPPGEFDLVVVSEVGYFLSPADLDGLLDRIAGCLRPEGSLVLCHWRHPVRGWPLDGPRVHDVFRSSGRWREHATYLDRDIEIVVLGAGDAWPEPTR